MRNTLVVRHHADLAALDERLWCFWSTVPCERACSWEVCYPLVVAAARARGYDTIQFTNYDGELYADYEIWDLNNGMPARQVGPYLSHVAGNGCLPGMTRGLLTRGWGGGAGECVCRSSGAQLNCDDSSARGNATTLVV